MYTNHVKKKIEDMHLKERIAYGYKKVIILMMISGLLSIMVICMLFASLVNYVDKINATDIAVKMCRVNVNAAARNIREMALNDDQSSYDGYESTITKLLADVDSQLKIIRKSGVVSNENYEEYATALSDWEDISSSILKEIRLGQDQKGVDDILTKCTPALNKLVSIALKLDDITDVASDKAVRKTIICAIAGIICIIFFLSMAWIYSKKTSKKVLFSILEPLHAIEDVAKELTEGNLHSTLEYRSEDEIGRLAHSMRKSIRILGSYVDDIDRAMKMFAEGNFDVKPEVEWKGDFVGILNSFMLFEESMAETIKGIQRVSDEVSSAAEQVASSSNELADGATNQAAVVEELTATVAGVAEQVEKNSQSAKQISSRVGNLGEAISESNSKMQEMVASMNDINEASKEIDKIIATINEIASQTNLLALNASIEAARAGEAGRGFAVVASEIRELSDSTKKLIVENNAKAEEIIPKINASIDSIKDLIENINEMNEKVATIAATSEEISSQTSCVQSMADELRDAVENI